MLVQYKSSQQIPACWVLWVCYRGIALWLVRTVATEKEKPLLVVITFSLLKSLLHFPTESFPPSAYLSVSHGALCRISLFTWTLPLTLCYINFLSSQPIFSACSLASHSFARPTFHLFLWGVFLSDIDWIYLSAAVTLWKWVVSLVILSCLLSLYQQL